MSEPTPHVRDQFEDGARTYPALPSLPALPTVKNTSNSPSNPTTSTSTRQPTPVDGYDHYDREDQTQNDRDQTAEPATGRVSRHARTVYDEVAAERVRAHAKHGATSMESAPVDDPTGMRRDILLEEIGEVAKEFNEARHDGRPVDLAAVRRELIQVAAMAAAWADAIAEVLDV